MQKKKNIVLCQLGSPKSTKVQDVRSYLKEFLSDPRVIDVPRVLWFFILRLFILPTRPKRSAEAYKRIEFCGFFPLIELTKKFSSKVQVSLGDEYKVLDSYILSEPRVGDVVVENHNCIVFPQFPQFSDTTTSSVKDCIEKKIPNINENGSVTFIPYYHRLKAFIDLSAKRIEEHIAKYPVEELIISFHGIPVRYVTQKKDPYYKHCCETYMLLKEKINFPKENIHMTFQSRLGNEQWLNPYTDEFATELADKGVKSIGVYCPSFVVDCLETTDEIGNELGEELEEKHCELSFIPCLNVDDNWCDAYADFIKACCEKKFEEVEKSELFYQIDEKKLEGYMPKLETKQNPLSPKAKKTIKILFLTLFLDLIGFSIIFPMFPSLAKYYLDLDPSNPFLQFIFGSIMKWTDAGGVNMSSIVLFGGVLGALYSLLQFFAAPVWGSLSDRFGRKPILMVTIFGLFVSYIMWALSGSFTILILARFIGGIMGGNISTATAAIADVTDKSNRSKGMAFVGIAFAFGFIFGPAIGGVLTVINPVDHFPSLVQYGWNPFSYAACFAGILSFINLVILVRSFEETKPEKITSDSDRTSNIGKLFTPLKNKNVNFTNYAYFLFLSAFSGLEFTLTFLAVERFSYNSLDNAYMFIFIGFIIAFVQGGVVRRKAHTIGEKKMAVAGLVSVIPGLIIISVAKLPFLLYLGLFFLAIGSALAIPTLTSLVSLNSSESEQGRSLGIFRSLGALGRIIGPIVASVLYWRLGSVYPYLIGAFFIIIPLFILNKVEQKAENN